MHGKLFTKKVGLLRSAIAGSALLAASGAAMAEPVSLDLEYSCVFPLIGAQIVTVTVDSDIPSTNVVGQPTGAFPLSADARVPEAGAVGLGLVGAKTIEGSAIADAIATLPGGGELPISPVLEVPLTDIPSPAAAFSTTATGETPSLTFTETGEVAINVADLTLDITARNEDGSIAPAPLGEFIAPCENLSENTLLTTVTIVDDGPEEVAGISLSDDALAFGEVQSGTTAEQTLTITSSGTADLNVSSVMIASGDADAFTIANNCATAVAPDDTCTVVVTYAASAEGDNSATLEIVSNDPDMGTSEVALSGTSTVEVVPAALDADASVDFGTVTLGETATADVTVTNTGGEAVAISGVAATGAFTTADSCGTLDPSASCTVSVTFTPTEAGDATGTLDFTTEVEGVSASVALTGTGEEEGVIVTPPNGDLAFDLDGVTYVGGRDARFRFDGDIVATVGEGGSVMGDLNLNATEAKFRLSKSLGLIANADVTLEPVGDLTGTLTDGGVTVTQQVNVMISDVSISIFGYNVSIGGGEQCGTVEPATIELTSRGPVTEEGAVLAGRYTMPEIANCGQFTDFLNGVITGEEKSAAKVTLTPMAAE